MIYMDAEYKHWLFELTSAIFWKVATAPWSNAVWLIWELEQYFQWYKKWEQHKYLNIENDRPELEQCLYPGPRGHSLGNSPGASGRPPSCSQWSPGHRRVVGGSGNFSRCRIAWQGRNYLAQLVKEWFARLPSGAELWLNHLQMRECYWRREGVARVKGCIFINNKELQSEKKMLKKGSSGKQYLEGL